MLLSSNQSVYLCLLSTEELVFIEMDVVLYMQRDVTRHGLHAFMQYRTPLMSEVLCTGVVE